jgi:predicted MPP superfamily phosphohydrolase
MKGIKAACNILILTLLFGYTFSSYHKKLKFNANGEFTILQFTDLHYGDHPEKDTNSSIIEEILLNHIKPDIITITGDAVSGYAWNGRNQTYYQDLWHQFTDPMKKLKIPYLYTLGNHDHQANYNPKQIIDLDSSHDYSMMQYNPNVTGASNYWIPIYSSNNSDIVAIMWMVDSNDMGCADRLDSWGCLERDEVQWYATESNRIRQKLGYMPQGFVWYHIPIAEYRISHNWRKTYGMRNEQISCPRRNTGFFAEQIKQANMRANFCGHDHNNDEGGILYGIELSYGRKTGYGSYGPDFFQRGARVMKLKEYYDTKSGHMSFNYTHFVAQEDGTTAQNSQPTWKGFYDYVDSCLV